MFLHIKYDLFSEKTNRIAAQLVLYKYFLYFNSTNCFDYGIQSESI